MRKPSARPKCSTDRWRWWAPDFPILAFSQNDETRAGHRSASRANSRRAARACCSPAAPPRARASLPVDRGASRDRTHAHDSEFLPARRHARASTRGLDPDVPPHLAQSDRDRLMLTALINGRVLRESRASSTGSPCSSTDERIMRHRARDDARVNAAVAHDLNGHRLLPGFIDTQVNGGGGVLFNDAPTVESIRAIGRAHRRFGTTGFLPDAHQRRFPRDRERARRPSATRSARACPACSASTSKVRS